MDESATTIREMESSLDKLQSEQQGDSRLLESCNKTAEQFLAKRGILSHKKNECQEKIRSLGALPEEAFEKYLQVSSKKVSSSYP